MEHNRKFDDTKDTFACRFYQRVSDRSPCHKMTRTIRLRLFDRRSRPLAHAPFVVTTSDSTASGFADPQGYAVVLDVAIPATCVVQWSRPSARLDTKPPDRTWRDFEFQHTVHIDLDAPGMAPAFGAAPLSPGPDFLRLSNMGYIFKDTPEANVRAFQVDAGLPQTGVLADAASKIVEQHDVVVAPPAPRSEQAV